MLRALTGFLCLCFSIPAQAKLGETVPQLVKRFGKSYTVEEVQLGKTYKFRSANISLDVVVSNGRSVCETYFSDHPLTASGEPPNDIVRAILRTNVPKARWVEMDAAPLRADYALQSSDHEYVAFLRYKRSQPENAVWTMTVARRESWAYAEAKKVTADDIIRDIPGPPPEVSGKPDATTTTPAPSPLPTPFVTPSPSAPAKYVSTDPNFGLASTNPSPSPSAAVAATQGTPPAPEEARKHFAMGTTLFKDAKTAADFSQAESEFKQAAHLAPDWPDARYNLALAKEAAGDYSGAIADLTLYQQFTLSDSEARKVQDKIYALEAKEKQQAGVANAKKQKNGTTRIKSGARRRRTRKLRQRPRPLSTPPGSTKLNSGSPRSRAI
jgi:hypothetical protein